MINIMMDMHNHAGNEGHNMTPLFNRTLMATARNASVCQTE